MKHRITRQAQGARTVTKAIRQVVHSIPLAVVASLAAVLTACAAGEAPKVEEEEGGRAMNS